MKKITKLLSAMLAVMMLVSSVGMIAFAENADVTVAFASAGIENADKAGDPLIITNVYNTTSGHESVEGWYIKGGKVTLNFSEEMDVATLNPTNIKIKLAGNSYIRSDNTKLNTVDNGDGTSTYYWNYTWYEATSTSYTIDIGDMCEGTMVHTIVFTDGVKTAAGTAINEVAKQFKTGRILPRTGLEGKSIKNVAYGKEMVYIKDGSETSITKATQYQSVYEQGNRSFIQPDKWTKIDLGNYYDIYDIGFFTHWDADKTWLADNTVSVAYSNDPEATGDTATSLGTMAKGQFYYSGNKAQGSPGGRGFSRFLKPSSPIRARYLFIKSTGFTAGEPMVEFKVYAAVDADYGLMTAEKDGSAVTSCAGAGEYTFKVPVHEVKTGSAGGYMIIAGYDINGGVKAIKCEAVSYADSALTMTAEMPDGTVSIKATLIGDFTSPYLLTDVLELPAAAE